MWTLTSRDAASTLRDLARVRARLAELELRVLRHADRLPDAGGVTATVVVTMPLDTLLGADRVATLDTGDRIAAGEARRLACEAGLMPAVLGGASQVLDLGRARRFHSGRQRIAIALGDRTCTAEGCDWPPAM